MSPTDPTAARVAIVHERFTELGGSERVVEQLHEIWPSSTIHAPIVDRAELPSGLVDAEIASSALQRLHRPGRSYAPLLPLLPLAIRSLDVGDVDLVITSHHAFANRVRVAPGTPVISYTHTPARWMWDPSMRATEVGGRIGQLALRAFSATQRHLDRSAARRLSGVIVNSSYIAERVRRYWGLPSTVVAPPVDVGRFTVGDGEREDFFLLAGRLVPYKRPELAVLAAKRAGVPLVVAGDGRMRRQVEELAGPRTTILGAVSDGDLVDLYRRCRALLYPGVEDFGIVPVEAQACGTPVIAVREGGVLDSVIHGVTGVLYEPGGDAVESLATQLRLFDGAQYDAGVVRRHAETFSPDRFRSEIVAVVAATLARSGP